MNLALRSTLLAGLIGLCAACRPEPPPTDDPPEPQATAAATELRDTIQAPIDKAKAVEEDVQKAADARAEAMP
jgi:hypothetical protein